MRRLVIRIGAMVGIAVLVIGLVLGRLRDSSRAGSAPTPTISSTSSRVGGAPTPTVTSTPGDLLTLVRRFVDRIPGTDSEGYHPPGPEERARLSEAFRAVEAGDLSRAAAEAGPLDYSVVRYTDAATGRALVILAEHQRPDGSWPHGWGLFIHSPEASRSLVVEVPHPIFDVNTEIVGTELFRMADASDLLVAGAHREADASGAADVAHRADSMFEAIHEVLARPGAVIVQAHGFEDGGSEGQYGDAVLSSGTSIPGSLTLHVGDALSRAGYRVCVYDGVQCSLLGATTNVQGAFARRVGALFLHMELAPPLREVPSEADRLERTVAAALRSWAS